NPPAKSVPDAPEPSILSSSPSRPSPILPIQPLHSPKLPPIRRHQRQLTVYSLPRYQHVVRSNGSTHPLQAPPDFSRLPRVFLPEFQHSHQTFKKHLHAPRIRIGLLALRYAVP